MRNLKSKSWSETCELILSEIPRNTVDSESLTHLEELLAKLDNELSLVNQIETLGNKKLNAINKVKDLLWQLSENTVIKQHPKLVYLVM